MFKLVIIWSIIFGPFLLNGQSNIDSIFANLENQDDSSKFRSLLQIYADFRYDNKDISKIATANLIETANRTEDAKYISKALNIKGQWYFLEGEYDSTLHYLDQSNRYAVTLEGLKKQMADNFHLQALVHYYLSAHEKAIELNFQALEIRKVHDPDGVIRSLNNIGISYENLNQYDLALKYYKECLSYAKTDYDFASLYNNMGIILVNEGNFQEALPMLRKGKDLSKKLNNTHLTIDLVGTLSRTYAGLQMMDSSILFSEEYIQLAKLINDPPRIITSLSHHGGLLSKAENYTGAIKFLKQAEQLIEETDIREQEHSVYIELIKVYENIGDYDQGYKYLKKYGQFKDSLNNERNQKIINELDVKYETAKKDIQLASTELDVQKKTNQRNIYIALLLGFVGLASFSFYQMLIRKQNNENRIALQNEKIQNLQNQQKLIALDYMVQGQEKERKRIAQDLHDGLGGLLATAQFQMKNIEKEIEKLHSLKLFTKAEEIINSACVEVRRIAHEMMPSSLEDLGLIATIEDLIENLQSQNSINIDVDIPNDDPDLSDIQLVNIYRILQETTTNVIKYADAKNLSIKLQFSKDLINLQVTDDGRGFDISDNKNQEGLGIKGIKSRVQYLNGTIKIDTQSGHGTKYKIQLPVDSGQTI